MATASKSSKKNKVTLGGKLVELSELTETTGTNRATGTPCTYLRFDGRIQPCDNDNAALRFSTFISSVKNDGSPSVNYDKVKSWYERAIPRVKVIKNADGSVSRVEVPDDTMVTMVEISGYLKDKSYVNRDGAFKSYTSIEANFFNDFKEFKAEYEFTASVRTIADEMRDGAPTGRKRISLVASGNKPVLFENVIVEQDNAPYISRFDHETANFYIRAEFIDPPKTIAMTGFGAKEVTSQSARPEYIAYGSDAPLKEGAEGYLSRMEINNLFKARKELEDTIIGEGYRGANRTSTAHAGFGGAPANNSVPDATTKTAKTFSGDDDDDDMPW